MRFVSVYCQFKDVNEFMEELEPSWASVQNTELGETVVQDDAYYMGLALAEARKGEG